MNDDLGDRMKSYEGRETLRSFLPFLPVVARIDGRGFSKFTKDMRRPYDERMSDAMIATTKYLVEKSNAVIGYTQSDEITLVWHTDKINSEIFFAGKVQKMVSVLAGMASSAFMLAVMKQFEDSDSLIKMVPAFDCRVFQVPNQIEAANCVLWRERDATKNAISMATRYYYPHKAMHKKSGSEMQEMLFQKEINFNDYPAFFKRGTFVRRQTVFRDLTKAELQRIPAAHRPTGPVQRSETLSLNVPPFNKVTNRVDFIFNGADPRTDETVS